MKEKCDKIKPEVITKNIIQLITVFNFDFVEKFLGIISVIIVMILCLIIGLNK